MTPLTAAEIAVFLGLTSAGVRKVISRKQIAPVGKQGRALTYDPREVIRHAGAHDRQTVGQSSDSVSH